jgi:hypothetical protein
MAYDNKTICINYQRRLKITKTKDLTEIQINFYKICRSKVELVLSYGSQFSEFIFILNGSEF